MEQSASLTVKLWEDVIIRGDTQKLHEIGYKKYCAFVVLKQ